MENSASTLQRGAFMHRELDWPKERQGREPRLWACWVLPAGNQICNVIMLGTRLEEGSPPVHQIKPLRLHLPLRPN